MLVCNSTSPSAVNALTRVGRVSSLRLKTSTDAVRRLVEIEVASRSVEAADVSTRR